MPRRLTRKSCSGTLLRCSTGCRESYQSGVYPAWGYFSIKSRHRQVGLLRLDQTAWKIAKYLKDAKESRLDSACSARYPGLAGGSYSCQIQARGPYWRRRCCAGQSDRSSNGVVITKSFPTSRQTPPTFSIRRSCHAGIQQVFHGLPLACSVAALGTRRAAALLSSEPHRIASRRAILGSQKGNGLSWFRRRNLGNVFAGRGCRGSEVLSTSTSTRASLTARRSGGEGGGGAERRV